MFSKIITGSEPSTTANTSANVEKFSMARPVCNSAIDADSKIIDWKFRFRRSGAFVGFGSPENHLHWYHVVWPKWTYGGFVYDSAKVDLTDIFTVSNSYGNVRRLYNYSVCSAKGIALSLRIWFYHSSPFKANICMSPY